MPGAYHCLHSPSLCCFSFGPSNMSASTASLYGRAVIAEHLAGVVRLSVAANLMNARAGHLTAQWSVSSRRCTAWWEQPDVERGHKVVRAVQDAAIWGLCGVVGHCAWRRRTCCGLEGAQVRLLYLVIVLHRARCTIVLEDRTAVSTADLCLRGLRRAVAGWL